MQLNVSFDISNQTLIFCCAVGIGWVTDSECASSALVLNTHEHSRVWCAFTCVVVPYTQLTQCPLSMYVSNQIDIIDVCDCVLYAMNICSKFTDYAHISGKELKWQLYHDLLNHICKRSLKRSMKNGDSNRFSNERQYFCFKNVENVNKKNFHS